MIVIILLIGVVLIVAAVRNSQGALFSALAQDVPNFVVWAAAIFALGAVGFIPGLKPISRALLGLIILVIVVNNYQTILVGFQHLWQSPPPAQTANDNKKSSGSGFLGSLDPLLNGGDLFNAFGSHGF